jgi:hypothetical protein
MGEAKRRRKASKPKPISAAKTAVFTDYVPISDTPEISTTTIYPTIDAMWLETIANHPAMQDVSRERREMTKYAFYTAVSETLRTVAFRINADQDTRIFDEFGKELRAYDKELQRAAESYAAALN